MKPRLKREWIGLLVRLRHTIRNKRGDLFRKGSIMQVTYNRGGLHLSRLHPGRDGLWQGRVINKVSEHDVEIVGRCPPNGLRDPRADNPEK